jgi:hypothetical protein
MPKRKQPKPTKSTTAIKKVEPATAQEMDFGSSPLRFEYDAVLEEYRTVWAEIGSRGAIQSQTLNLSITALAAILGIGPFLFGAQPLSTTLHFIRPVLPLLSMVFAAFAVLYNHQLGLMAYLGIYSNTMLRPRIERILEATGNDASVWGWNEWRVKNEFRKFPDTLFDGALAGGGPFLVFVPCVAFAVAFWLPKDPTEPILPWEIILSALSIIGILWVIVTAAFVSRLFGRLDEHGA